MEPRDFEPGVLDGWLGPNDALGAGSCHCHQSRTRLRSSALGTMAHARPAEVAVELWTDRGDQGRGEQRLTWIELLTRTEMVASVAARSGVAEGEIAVIMLPPGLESLVADLAVATVGATRISVGAEVDSTVLSGALNGTDATLVISQSVDSAVRVAAAEIQDAILLAWDERSDWERFADPAICDAMDSHACGQDAEPVTSGVRIHLDPDGSLLALPTRRRIDIGVDIETLTSPDGLAAAPVLLQGCADEPAIQAKLCALLLAGVPVVWVPQVHLLCSRMTTSSVQLAVLDLEGAAELQRLVDPKSETAARRLLAGRRWTKSLQALRAKVGADLRRVSVPERLDADVTHVLELLGIEVAVAGPLASHPIRLGKEPSSDQGQPNSDCLPVRRPGHAAGAFAEAQPGEATSPDQVRAGQSAGRQIAASVLVRHTPAAADQPQRLSSGDAEIAERLELERLLATYPAMSLPPKPSRSWFVSPERYALRNRTQRRIGASEDQSAAGAAASATVRVQPTATSERRIRLVEAARRLEPVASRPAAPLQLVGPVGAATSIVAPPADANHWLPLLTGDSVLDHVLAANGLSLTAS